MTKSRAIWSYAVLVLLASGCDSALRASDSQRPTAWSGPGDASPTDPSDHPTSAANASDAQGATEPIDAEATNPEASATEAASPLDASTIMDAGADAPPEGAKEAGETTGEAGAAMDADSDDPVSAAADSAAAEDAGAAAEDATTRIDGASDDAGVVAPDSAMKEGAETRLDGALDASGGEVSPDSALALDAAADDGEAADSGDPVFEACHAQLRGDCAPSEMTTAAQLQTPCSALTTARVPLSDGGYYEAVTLEQGPYGSKVEWNQGAQTSFVNEVNSLEDICASSVIEGLGEPKAVKDNLENLRDVDLSLYTIFRPACFKQGEIYPVITWANATCIETAGYMTLLSTLASHGFVVVAANSTWTNNPPTNAVQLHALDYARALNEDPTSLFYQKLDLNNIGAMGHGQGAFATAYTADDPRVKAVLFWDSGTSNRKPFLDISGELDLSNTSPQGMASDVGAATMPGAWLYFHKVLQTGGGAPGYFTPVEQPDRAVDIVIAWWTWQLKGDEEAKKSFVGDACGLCSTSNEFEFGRNSHLQ